MKERRRRKWKRIRSKGKWRFVLVVGVLLWAYPTGVLVELVAESVELFPFALRAPTWPWSSTGEVVIFLIAWTIGGIGFGLWQWHENERKYKQEKDEAAGEPSS